MKVTEHWIIARRNELLAKSTSAEKSVHKILLSESIRCIRQYPILTGRRVYFADIFIPSVKLVVELDGAYHETDSQSRLDGNRSQGIRRLGIHVCRIKNRDAYSAKKVLLKIRRYFQ